MPLDFLLTLFFAIFSFMNTIRETKQKNAPNLNGQKNVIQSLPMMLLAIPVEKPSVQT